MESQEIVATALMQFGNEIETVFCNNDGMTLGAYAAISSAGRIVGENIYLLGIDGTDDCINMVAEGKITGTVLASYIDLAHQTVDIVHDFLINDAELPDYYWVAPQKVDASYFPYNQKREISKSRTSLPEKRRS